MMTNTRSALVGLFLGTALLLSACGSSGADADAPPAAAVGRSASEFSPGAIERLHVIGGGSRNSLLHRLTARELGMPLVAGPVEATAKGNILLQAMATGELADLEELRQVSGASTELVYYEPGEDL